MSDKNEIRAKMRALRKNFAGEGRESADREILNSFISVFGGFDGYFIYNSFSSEARTDLIQKELLKAGKRVYLPRVEGKDMVAVLYGGGFKEGAFKISEPLGEPYSGDINVTAIPLLAVNGRGYRIGYGGGFYDRYLKDKTTLKVGLGYDFQMTDFEEEPFDVPLDYFVSEKGIKKFGKKGGGL